MQHHHKNEDKNNIEKKRPGASGPSSVRGKRFTPTLRGGPPSTSQGNFLGLVPPRKLFFSMQMFASICVRMLVTF